MKALHIVFFVEAPSIGGAERYLLDLTRGLAERGHRVTVACPTHLQEAFQQCGLKTIPIHIGPKLTSRNFFQLAFLPLMLLSFVRLIGRIQEQQAIDILHVQFKKEQMIVALTARFLKVKIVWTEHGPLHDFIARNPLLVWVYRVAASSASRIIVVSKATESNLRSVGIPARKLVKIYNGIACEPIPSPATIVVEENSVAVVGRLIEEKGVIHLLRALKILNEENHDIRLFVVGDGPLREDLENYVGANGLSERVSFTGRIPQTRVREIVEKAVTLVQPSIGGGEGLPYAVLEAMAIGKPIIATSNGGLPELVVDGETGIIVPPADPKRLAAAIIRILEDRQAAGEMGMKAKKRAETEFSLGAMIRNTEAVFLDSIDA
ncbi:MAG: glycosyltransferase family 4 protein [Chloroflexota bacterium]|nr:glycosyltransferase family 4 protein [Chloroflexota bacterium]